MQRMLEHKAAVKEMEAAAVAWSADLFGVPAFCIKAVTDIVDGDRPAQEEFLENLGKVGVGWAAPLKLGQFSKSP